MNEPLAKHKIIIEIDDSDLIKPCEKFIKDLENEYSNFKEKLEIDIEKWHRILCLNEKDKMLCLNSENKRSKCLNNKDIFFIPEEISIKSPLTIIDAPWGSGKTFFIESLAKNIIEKKVKFSIFKKIILIDIWKYSNSKNLPDDIIIELFSILANQMGDFSKNFKKIAKKLFNITVISWLNKTMSTNIEEISSEESIEEIIKGFKKMPKTIIFFDNLERVGNGSWDILKAIQKLSILDHFLFILPMNKKKMIDPTNKSNPDESIIEKYLTLPFFYFWTKLFWSFKNYGIWWKYFNII